MEGLYFVEFVGTYQGTKIEREVKDFCHDHYNHRLCTAKGRIIIYGEVVELAQKLHNANPKTSMPAIVLNGAEGDLHFETKNAIDNFRILSFKRVLSVVHDEDENGFTYNKKED